jgi:hypothetical protein
VFVCEGANIINYKDPMWASHPKNIKCGVPRPENASLIVDYDLVLAHSLGFLVFQHDFINGVPQAGILMDFVGSNAKSCLICASRLMAEILSASSSCVLERSKLPEEYWARSLRFSLGGYGSTWDTYPVGSFHPMRNYIHQQNLTVSPVPKVLFFSRGNSNRRIVNENALINAAKEMALSNGYIVDIVPHGAVTDKNLIRNVYSSWFIIGLHGGLFSNIAFCSPNAVVIEINNVDGRDCFAGMALALQLRYQRFPKAFDYVKAEVDLSPKEIRMLIAMIEFPV